MNYRDWNIEVGKVQVREKIRIPEITREQYDYRDKKLKAYGMLEWERFWLVAHRINSPGTKLALDARKRIYLKAQESGMSKIEYAKQIKDRYEKEGWEFNNGKPNPFDMIANYRDKETSDRTPYPKQKKITKNYIKAKKATEERRKNDKYDANYVKTQIKPWQKRLEKQMFKPQ